MRWKTKSTQITILKNRKFLNYKKYEIEKIKIVDTKESKNAKKKYFYKSADFYKSPNF